MSDLAPLKRIDYGFTLEVLSALHIGTGETHPFRPEDEDEDERTATSWQVSTIIRDHENKPYIPGTSLKGLLRGIARDQGDDNNSDTLFGVVKNDDTGRMGALYVHGARQVKAADATGLPFAKEGVFINAQTAIDAGRGISETNKLFHAEAVAPGAQFEVCLRLEARDHIENLEQILLQILAQLDMPEGVSLGADGASGLGRVKLAEAVTKTLWQADPVSGALRKGDRKTVTLPVLAERSATYILTLSCEGPYLQQDFSWDSERRRKEKAGNDGENLPHLRALRYGNTPYLTGDTVSGAFRARLNWLVALATHREEKRDHLTSNSVKRLFGDVGQRGILTVRVTDITRKGSMRNTSVRIDRFSGGTIDNALYATDSDFGVTITLSLELDRRANGDDQETFSALERDIRDNGLQLGHGIGKGFGWFRVGD